MMNEADPTEIEVEVVGVENLPVSHAPAPSSSTTNPFPSSPPPMSDWRHWGGRVRSLDGKWWPLWIILGTIALFFLLTVGLLFGVCYALTKGLVHAIRSLLPQPR